jgi:aspartate/methionine/tyrosine aminotransferase
VFLALNSLLDKEDHVIVHYPCYQSLSEIVVSIGCELTEWKTSDATNWKLDLDILKKSIKSNTKLIIVNVPHNPTGKAIK